MDKAKRDKIGIYTELLRLIEARGQALIYMNVERDQELNRAVQRQKRKERKERILASVSKDLDLRDRWCGIRHLKSDYNPLPYTQKDSSGKTVRVSNKAEGAATHGETDLAGEGG